MLVTTTDTHLVRGIGKAFLHDFHGNLKISSISAEDPVRIYWSR